jgi:membrane-bound lytic murein transglycosylase D
MQDSILAYAKKDFEAKGITEDEISTEPTPVYHKVRSGETLSTIARKYSTTVKNIKRWSNIKSDRLRIGQRLIVGWSNGVPPAKSSAKKTSDASSSKTSYHKVRKGETLSTIARKYGTTVQKIKKANNIKGDNIQVGQRLSIP